MLNLRPGMDVIGTDGKVGEASRMVVDPTHNAITGIVVKHGLLNRVEYVVPLDLVRQTDDGDLAVDFNEEQLTELSVFDPTQFREPDPDYTGPPGFDAAAAGVDNLALNSFVAMGSLSTVAGAEPALGFPGGEVHDAAELPWSSIRGGSDVVDAEGEKIGEVEEVGLDESSGRPERILVRSGWLFKKHVSVPAEWISEIRDDYVVIEKRKDELERLAG